MQALFQPCHPRSDPVRGVCRKAPAGPPDERPRQERKENSRAGTGQTGMRARTSQPISSCKAGPGADGRKAATMQTGKGKQEGQWT